MHHPDVVGLVLGTYGVYGEDGPEHIEHADGLPRGPSPCLLWAELQQRSGLGVPALMRHIAHTDVLPLSLPQLESWPLLLRAMLRLVRDVLGAGREAEFKAALAGRIRDAVDVVAARQEERGMARRVFVPSAVLVKALKDELDLDLVAAVGVVASRHPSCFLVAQRTPPPGSAAAASWETLLRELSSLAVSAPPPRPAAAAQPRLDGVAAPRLAASASPHPGWPPGLAPPPPDDALDDGAAPHALDGALDDGAAPMDVDAPDGDGDDAAPHAPDDAPDDGVAELEAAAASLSEGGLPLARVGDEELEELEELDKFGGLGGPGLLAAAPHARGSDVRGVVSPLSVARTRTGRVARGATVGGGSTVASAAAYWGAVRMFKAEAFNLLKTGAERALARAAIERIAREDEGLRPAPRGRAEVEAGRQRAPHVAEATTAAEHVDGALATALAQMAAKSDAREMVAARALLAAAEVLELAGARCGSALERGSAQSAYYQARRSAARELAPFGRGSAATADQLREAASNAAATNPLFARGLAQHANQLDRAPQQKDRMQWAAKQAANGLTPDAAAEEWESLPPESRPDFKSAEAVRRAVGNVREHAAGAGGAHAGAQANTRLAQAAGDVLGGSAARQATSVGDVAALHLLACCRDALAAEFGECVTQKQLAHVGNAAFLNAWCSPRKGFVNMRYGLGCAADALGVARALPDDDIGAKASLVLLLQKRVEKSGSVEPAAVRSASDVLRKQLVSQQFPMGAAVGLKERFSDLANVVDAGLQRLWLGVAPPARNMQKAIEFVVQHARVLVQIRHEVAEATSAEAAQKRRQVKAESAKRCAQKTMVEAWKRLKPSPADSGGGQGPPSPSKRS